MHTLCTNRGRNKKSSTVSLMHYEKKIFIVLSSVNLHFKINKIVLLISIHKSVGSVNA